MEKPVLIIGAGPAGLACAGVLAEAGRAVVLLDENRQAGGQYHRQLAPGLDADYRRLPHDRQGFAVLAGVLVQPNVRLLTATTAWAATAPGEVGYAGPDGSGRIAASAVVLATGAQDMPLPFPGWTLPGVISAGGCLNMVKGQGMVPAGRVVVAGNGPLVLVAAATLLKAGANVVGVFEAQRSRRLLGAVWRGALAAPGILRQALAYHATLARHGVALRGGWMIAGAEGGDAFQTVTLAPVGTDGRPAMQGRRRIDADVLVTGYGLLPGAEPARLFGCAMRLDAGLNGLVPERSDRFETSLPGVYAVGDGAGIGGVRLAVAEGRLAAFAILGRTPPPAELVAWRRLDGFRRALNLAYRCDPPLLAATPDTVICRCEALRLSELAGHPRLQAGSLNVVKTATRLGMGRCQGRNCLPAAAQLLGLSPEDIASRPRMRPPLRPIPLCQIAGDKDARPVREPDEPILQHRNEPT